VVTDWHCTGDEFDLPRSSVRCCHWTRDWTVDSRTFRLGRLVDDVIDLLAHHPVLQVLSWICCDATRDCNTLYPHDHRLCLTPLARSRWSLERPRILSVELNLGYPVEGSTTICQDPNTMVVFGRPKGDRGSYKQWTETGISPQVVFRILSPSNRLSKLTPG
jgi:hypothetical protein